MMRGRLSSSVCRGLRVQMTVISNVGSQNDDDLRHGRADHEIAERTRDAASRRS